MENFLVDVGRTIFQIKLYVNSSPMLGLKASLELSKSMFCQICHQDKSARRGLMIDWFWIQEPIVLKVGPVLCVHKPFLAGNNDQKRII